jgi:hypothetical protein
MEKGIKVIFGAEAVSVHEKASDSDDHYILCKNGHKIQFYEVIWCTQVCGLEMISFLCKMCGW